MIDFVEPFGVPRFKNSKIPEFKDSKLSGKKMSLNFW